MVCVCFSDSVHYSKLVTKGEDIVVVGLSLAGQVVVVKMKGDGMMNSQNSLSAAWVTKETRWEPEWWEHGCVAYKVCIFQGPLQPIVMPYPWLSARLQYLQCVSNGDTAVLP